MSDTVYRVNLNTQQLRILLERVQGPFFDRGPVAAALRDGVRAWGALLQWRARRNVSGYPVVWAGGAFRVMPRTGTLQNAIELQYPYMSALQARVFVNGTAMNPGTVPGVGGRPRSVSEYAAAIELGHKEIDLKRMMRGKTVPFFAARGANAKGPYAARGLDPLDPGVTGYGSSWTSQQHNAKLAAKGKGPMVFEKKGGNAAYLGAKASASTYFISFRKVGRTGWIIPAARPRPFMAAALASTKEEGRRMLVKRVTAALDLRR